ncbi:hypothetical protein [Geopsychrobacter electrodiphilus]|nr:hypothetical protein [Geopsychrobacter electrodiphilus]
MKEVACDQCGILWSEDELLKREDNGQLICPECSGLLEDEDLSCHYDESG